MMEITIKETAEGILVSGLTLFSLDDTLDCGQCFRFHREEGGWRGVAGNRPLFLREQPGGLLLSCCREEFEEFWRGYFDLDRDYAALRDQYLAIPALQECARYAPGIRVLRQDAWEALISFILSQNNNVKRIQGIVSRLCSLFGAPCGEDPSEPDGLAHAFPLPAVLAERTEEELAPLRAGWRTGYVLDAARKVASGEINLSAIAAAPLSEAREKLQSIRGVGPKVADCVLLYGMGRTEAFPMDVWMKRAMKELFPGCTPADFGECAGIAQQYIFHYCRRHPSLVRKE